MISQSAPQIHSHHEAPIERVLARFPEAKPSRNGWEARCPAHEDRRASLSISEGADGRALLICHAKCSVEAVCTAVGLRVVDLMPTADTLTAPRASKRTDGSGFAGRSPGKAFARAGDAVAELERRHGARSTMWTYHDANDEPVGVVVRWNLSDGKKDIRPVSLHSDGWRIGGMPEPRPLYGLSYLAGLKPGEPVVVTEGEKAADAAIAVGLAGATSAHGARSAAKTDWSPLAGRDVLILPDADDAGEKYAEDVASILTGLSPPATVKIVRLPGLPGGGDMDDFVRARPDARPEEIRRIVSDLADAAAPWNPPAEVGAGPVVSRLSDIDAREVSWLWPGRLPLGRISLLVGRPGEGKSFLTLDMASRISTGSPWPDGSECTRGSVLLLTAEDDPADTIRPRLDAHHADASRVHVLAAVRRIDDDGPYERLASLLDVDAIGQAISMLGDCRLLVVDPIGSFLGGRTDAHRDNEVRSVLAPIARLAEEHGVAVLVVAHRRKSTAGSADDLALGSRAFTGIARAVWHLSRDPENKSRRLLLPGKNNLAREGSGLAFSIVDEPARIAWERDPVEMDADEGVEAENASAKPLGRPDHETKAAKTFLRSALADGPRLAKEVTEEAREGHGVAKRTLDRARSAIGVDAYRPSVPGPWWWRLTPPEGDDSKDARTPKRETFWHSGSLAENTGKTAVLDPSKPKDAKSISFGNLGNSSPDDDPPPDDANRLLAEAADDDATTLWGPYEPTRTARRTGPARHRTSPGGRPHPLSTHHGHDAGTGRPAAQAQAGGAGPAAG